MKTGRYLFYLMCAVQLFFAIAFFWQWPLVTNLWPFAGTTPLTYIFISSIFAAAVASTFWAVASGNYGALAGIGLDYFGILMPVAIFSFHLGASSDSTQLTAYGAICVLGALFGLWLFWWSRRFPLDASIPTPRPLWWSFVIFIIALVIVSTRLILQAPNAIPWKITPELSVVIGWMFVGAALYFAYGLWKPYWSNAAGQLAGFLAYDVVLIVPFLTRLPTVADEDRLGLTIYTAVVIYSGLLAIYYLFIHKTTRVFS